MKNKVGIIIALISGIILILGGVTSTVGIYGLIPWIALVLGFPPEILAVINLVLLVLNLIASLGGIAVIIGALLVAKERIGTGKLFIGLGAGMGLIGFIFLVLIMTLTGTPIVSMLPLVYSTPGLLGGILSILARFYIKT